jgi:glycosyltransferase involved in cell wall biosynthesis
MTMPATLERPAPVITAPNRPVRVCFMIDDLAAAGTESQLVALINRLDRDRVAPTLCLLRGDAPSSRALEPRDCTVYRLGIRSFKHPSTPAKVWRLFRMLRRERFDILQVYFPDSTYVGVLAGRLAGVPRIVRTRNNLGYWMKPRDRWLGRLCNRFTHALVANCEACRDAFVRDEGFVPGRMMVLENGVDLERFPTSRFERPRSRELRVGVVANLRPVKNLELFVRAAARVATECPQATFHIAGEGELRPALRTLAGQLGIGDRFFLPGSIRDVPAFLATLDVGVLCSHSEGMSNALLEYMAAGLAIAATDVGGNAQLLESGKCGMLVAPGDEAGLTRAMKHLLRDPTEAERLARAARRRVETHHSRDIMVERFQSFFEELAAEGGRR